MQSGNQQEAKAQFDAALSINPNEVNSLIGRGLIEYHGSALDAALRDFEQAAQIGSSPTARFWVGRVFEQEGKFPEAAISYQQALQMAPNLKEAQLHLKSVIAKVH